ncbi:uncharacterized protein MONOS_3252 [Monocercomonoides exilis]|uniref:uncharacterized protein n=1 Tax=Monocercomonoides exilis TaxID=2049356 RepID=UPI003559C2C5|nr:hypothetical protein MONOS_3252 [Monocercomonoides exilis]|eukprot:MONOS_3252.1-p1 / transcript=MONOS_3252.1 / gene=MONOS_3252 / organism=Monocercomonoides_exilis_PA203 / gene_product=unspecified product / transcript_product=unspecified product / location=Mono_scaffold00075:66739-67934(+) / protein_length=189 / sequence_SO=supercontig / SO=protein_coding / is_pseudo=false
MRYLGEIKGDWIPMQCELISYTNLSMPAPMSGCLFIIVTVGYLESSIVSSISGYGEFVQKRQKASEFNDDKHHACFAPITLFAPHLLSPSQRHLSGQSHFSLLNQISPLVHSSSSFASLNSPHVHPTQFTHSLPSVTDYQSSFIHANLPSYITLVQPEEVSSPSSVLLRPRQDPTAIEEQIQDMQQQQ